MEIHTGTMGPRAAKEKSAISHAQIVQMRFVVAHMQIQYIRQVVRVRKELFFY